MSNVEQQILEVSFLPSLSENREVLVKSGSKKKADVKVTSNTRWNFLSVTTIIINQSLKYSCNMASNMNKILRVPVLKVNPLVYATIPIIPFRASCFLANSM